MPRLAGGTEHPALHGAAAREPKFNAVDLVARLRQQVLPRGVGPVSPLLILAVVCDQIVRNLLAGGELHREAAFFVCRVAETRIAGERVAAAGLGGSHGYASDRIAIGIEHTAGNRHGRLDENLDLRRHAAKIECQVVEVALKLTDAETAFELVKLLPLQAFKTRRHFLVL